MTNRISRAAGNVGAAANHHRSRRLLVAAPEIAAIGHDNVNTGSGNAIDRLNCPGNFALKRANPGHFLHEAGQAERANLVKQLVTRGARGRQSAFRQQHPGTVGQTCRDSHGCAIRTGREIDVGFCKHQTDLVDVLTGETDIERLARRLVQEYRGPDNQQDRQGANPDKSQQFGLTESGQILGDL